MLRIRMSHEVNDKIKINSNKIILKFEFFKNNYFIDIFSNIYLLALLYLLIPFNLYRYTIAS